jgi:NAD(P)-dependent dehydrogenase (short-subunit alcohol dehydrogenase family)
MDESKSLPELISLKGKTALITGAAGGIGRAIAYRFAEAGAGLELVDLNVEALEALGKNLLPFTPVNIHCVDLAQEEEIEGLWERLKGKEPDILVNNAGIYPFKSFLEVDSAFLRKVMAVNLDSAFWMCQHMIRARTRRGAVIINIGSIEAILPFCNDLVHYNVSKAGVIALTRSLAREYGREGFRINAILPGGIVTPGTKEVAKEVVKLKLGLIKTGLDFRRRLPLGRGGQPDEVARVALFLASEMSSYVQGALVAVDGGFLSA